MGGLSRAVSLGQDIHHPPHFTNVAKLWSILTKTKHGLNSRNVGTKPNFALVRLSVGGSGGSGGSVGVSGGG